MCSFLSGFIIAAVAASAADATRGQGPSSAAPQAFPVLRTVVLAYPDDPYTALAREIAQEERLLLAETLEDALAPSPLFLLWVVAPERLSDKRLAEFGAQLREGGRSIAVGLITGRSLETSRELYRRAQGVKGQDVLIVNTQNRPSHRRAGIIHLRDDSREESTLNKGAVLARLQSTDYFVFNGHGSAVQFTLDEAGSAIESRDVPPLRPLIADSRGCQTLRIWEGRSIALEFIERGAAAYAGYFISPMSGWGMKGEAPFSLTWPGFPVGTAVSVLREGLRGNAQVAGYCLLGDPRIAFRPEPPYTITGDRIEGKSRIISVHPTSSGIVPLRIAGAAGYGFVSVIGVTSVSQDDVFSNSRLQIANFGEDKCVLYGSDGRDFVCSLAERAPALWKCSDTILDSLDAALLTLYAPDSGTHFILAALAGLGLAIALVRMGKSGAKVQSIVLAVIAGMALASFHGAYVLFRLDAVTVTANPVRFYPLSVLSTFHLASCGALVNFSSRSWQGRVLGAVLASAVPLFAALFLLLAIGSVNIQLASKAGLAPWGFNPAISAGITFAVQFALSVLFFEGLRRAACRLAVARPTL